MAEPVVSTRRTRGYERNKQTPSQDTSTTNGSSNQSNANQTLSPKTKNRLAQKAYRERLKNDEETYTAHRKFETLRVQAYRAAMSPDKKKKYNEKTKLRMKKYRERKKAQGIATPSRPKTRKENEKQRDIWRRNKQEQRLNMTAQKRRRINEQRRKKYHEKKQRTTPSDANLDSEANSVPENYQTDCAKRKAVSRSIKVLPKDANKFAEVVSRIIAKSTPRKKAALKEKCIASPSSKKRLDMLESSCINLKDTLRGIKKKRSKKDNHTRRLLNQIMLARNTLSGCKNLHEQFGLSKNINKKIDKGEDILEQERKKRKDALSEEDIKHVQDFYKKSYISREMPSMNAVNKMALEGSLKRTYDQYKHEYPDKKISYAKFANLRPKQVLPMSKQKYMQCLCEYCINIDFKIETLKSFCSVRKLESIAVDRYDISRITLCPKEGGHYKKDCLDRNCRDCGLTKIDEKVDRVLGNFKNSQVTWKRWQISEKESLVNGNKVTKSFMDMKRKSGTIENLVDELKTELSTFSKHLFNAQWQSKQFEDLKVNLPKKWVLMCLDFAENYTCRHQDEAQGAHWRYEQVTIHPLVTYYHCPIEGCTHIMRESLVFISEDHKHDYHMVQHCVAKANAYLLENLEEISKQIQFSDGAPTQYKSKYNFVDLSYSNDDFGFETEKHFFGSRHGKGPCDGESGVVKRSATVAVGTRGCIISNAHDFFEYAKNQLTLPKQNSETHCHSKRTFFFIKADEVVRERPDRTHRVKTLQNSRSMFSFRGIQPYITTSRERSCFCAICIGQETGVCPVQSLTGQWKVNNLKIRERHRRNQQTVTEETVNADHVDVNAEIHEMDNPDVPEMDNPDVPEIDNPDVPEMDNPDVPEMDNPDVPEMDIADLDNPEVPEIDNPDVPEMDNPEVPEIDSPDIQEMIIAEIENLGVPEMDNPVKDQINDLEMFPLEDLDVNQLDIDMPQTEVPLYSVGQYVVSSLSSDKRISPTLFIAQIKDIGSDEVFLKFMAKDTSGFYYWPSNDQGWEPFKSIKRVIEEPTPVPEKSKKRRLLYRVDF